MIILGNQSSVPHFRISERIVLKYHLIITLHQYLGKCIPSDSGRKEHVEYGFVDTQYLSEIIDTLILLLSQTLLGKQTDIHVSCYLSSL
jgi:hypothetical protein